MAELLLVSNPHKRRRRKSRRARRSNPHRAHRRSHRSNPYRMRRRTRRNPHRIHHRRRRSNPHFRAYRRRRRGNPSLRGFTGRIMPTVKAGFVGAGGALANDVVSGFVSPYLTSFLATAGTAAPYVQYAVKMLTAIAVGMVGNMARFPGTDLAIGAATVATHDMLKSTLQSMAPTLFGAGGTFALSGYNGFGAYLSGSAPVVGTATFPQTNLPFQQSVQMGAYLSGPSGAVDGSGVYNDDAMGCDYWAS